MYATAAVYSTPSSSRLGLVSIEAAPFTPVVKYILFILYYIILYYIIYCIMYHMVWAGAAVRATAGWCVPPPVAYAHAPALFMLNII